MLVQSGALGGEIRSELHWGYLTTVLRVIANEVKPVESRRDVR
jgi:hypothetical protein